MAQYSSVKTNTKVSVTNGSSVVTGIGTLWVGNIQPGHGFTVAGDAIVYDVASVDSNTQITLSTNYSGVTNPDAHYTIHRDFTSPDNLPELHQGDIETATIMKRLARKVQGKFNQLTGLEYTGLWDTNTTYVPGQVVVSETTGLYSVYIANTENTGTKPPSAEWDLIFENVDTITFTSLSWVGEWTASTEYFEQNVISYQDNVYVVTANFTSGTSFDATNLDILIDTQTLNTLKVAAEDAAALSEQWAEEAVDVEVVTGKYSAKHHATKASGSASAASTSATNAATSETNAATSASNAATSETNAANSASAASTSASNAATSETNAANSANTSEDWATLTTGTVDGLEYSSKYYAQESSTSASNAATSASNAATSETNAANSASAAATSETNAATSASNAATSETNAANSANTSEDWAILTGATVDGLEYSSKHYSQESSASASAAATSETNAATSASNAATSETNAASSANTSEDWAILTGATVDGLEYSSKHYSQESSTSATNAANSASNAATSETNAATSASNAATSETNAAASENKAQQWADAPLGTEVEVDKYSARHWAEQLGAVPNSAYNWQGDWVAGTYNAGDAVFHVPSRSSYITLVTTSAEPNIDGTTDWQLLAKSSEFGDASFIVLNDTPTSYTGSAGLFVQVNGTEDGLVFSSVSSYAGWTLTVDGVNQGNIDSGESVGFVGGVNTTLSYNATGNVITIDSVDTDTTYTAGIGITLTGNEFSLTNEVYTTTEKNKLAGIESGATADQTASEIKTAYESNLDTNAYTDSEKTKLSGIATGADNYSSWTVSDGTTSEAISSGNTLTVSGSGATSAVYDSVSNTLTISSTDTDTTYTAGTGITLTGTEFALTGESYTTTEKNKLANIENDATADQTASEILTAIKTVDGSTSGLDADLLDGNHASAFALAGHTHNYDNYNGWDLYTDGTSRGRISSAENVNFAGGTNVNLTYDTTNNTITIASTDTNTTYSAGTGISLSGTTFNLTDEAYTTTEKNKLAGIESGATADQTASEILTALKTVDGSTSGLDADFLDGNHASAFALASHSHTAGDLPATIVYEGENISLLTNDSGYITDAPSDGTQYARLNGTWSEVTGGTSFTATASNITAADGDAILCDTSFSSFTVTLPAFPSVGDKVIVADAEDTWDVNNLIIDRNGNTIEGLADNVTCDIKGILITLVHAATTWQLYVETNSVVGDAITKNSTEILTNKTVHGDTNTLTVDGTNKIGFRNLPINGEKTSGYTATATDVGKCITIGTNGALTIPDFVFLPGDVFTVFNNTESDVTITCSTSTSFISGANNVVSSVTLATRGLATVFFVDASTSVITGNVS